MSNDAYMCHFCNSYFSLKRTLNYHIKNSKRCIEQRPKVTINCIWCKGNFHTKDELDKHNKKCEVDKDILYIKILEECKTKELLLKEKELLLKEKEKEIGRLNNIITDLTDKFNISSINTTNTTNNTINTTYNITLNCSKPLLLSKERIIELMDKTCEPVYIKRGQLGLADWFLNDVCRNDKCEISIECTDKNRKRFRYKDENDIPKEITGFSLIELLKECIEPFKRTPYYNQVKEQGKDENYMYQTTNIYESIKDFEKPGSKFINYLIDKTHIDSINCLIYKNK